MVHAAAFTTHQTLPESLDSPDASASVKALAAQGNFRAIALWLNDPLVGHGIFAQVQAEQPGCLHVLLEFDHLPDRDQLVRFICHRIWHLNSPVIEGVHIVARYSGKNRILWQQRVRVMTPAIRQQVQAQPVAHAWRTAATDAISPTLKQATVAKQMARQQRHTVLMSQHLKLLRSLLLTGSAVAAFVMGCVLEALLANPSPSLPTFAGNPPAIESAEGDSPTATPVAFNQTQGQTQAPEPRPTVVQTALEPVAVIPHQRVVNPADPTVTLLFGGEVDLEHLPHATVQADQSLMTTLSDYQTADVAMVNLGSSLATAATSLQEEYFNRTRPDEVDVLKQGGVDLVTLTSDRTMEYGAKGLGETLDTLDREGIYRVGAGRTEREARRPEILDVKGQRIAYLSYADEDFNAAHGDVAGVNSQQKQQIAEDIRAIRNQVDWIVVNYRWSGDLADVPADWQTNLARLAVDQGADVVVGHHPTKLQGAEVYKGRPIAYSLGDFIFGEAPNADHDTAALKVLLRDGQMKVELVPIMIRQAQPQVAQGKDASAILDKITAASSHFDQPLKSAVILEIRPKVPEGGPEAQPGSSFISPAEETPFSQPTSEPSWPAQAADQDEPAYAPDSAYPESDYPSLESTPDYPNLDPAMEAPAFDSTETPLAPPSNRTVPRRPSTIGDGPSIWDQDPGSIDRFYPETDPTLDPALSPGVSPTEPAINASPDDWPSNWGPKSTGPAHDGMRSQSEPNPSAAEAVVPQIPQPLPVQPTSPSIQGPALLEEVPISAPEEAIKPYNEPLVGPIGLNQPAGESSAVLPRQTVVVANVSPEVLESVIKPDKANSQDPVVATPASPAGQ